MDSQQQCNGASDGNLISTNMDPEEVFELSKNDLEKIENAKELKLRSLIFLSNLIYSFH
jgi:hypothetical protein